MSSETVLLPSQSFHTCAAVLFKAVRCVGFLLHNFAPLHKHGVVRQLTEDLIVLAGVGASKPGATGSFSRISLQACGRVRTLDLYCFSTRLLYVPIGFSPSRKADLIENSRSATFEQQNPWQQLSAGEIPLAERTLLPGLNNAPAGKITLTNYGTSTLSIGGIAITGNNADDFAQIHTCGSSLAVDASCTINVTFKPLAFGTRTAALNIRDNASGSPPKVSLSGIGTTAKLSPTSLNFGSVFEFTTTPAQTVTLTNVGTTSLIIMGVAITGTNAGYPLKLTHAEVRWQQARAAA